MSNTKGSVINDGEGGGLQNERGEHVRFYPYKKGGGCKMGKGFGHAEGGRGGGGGGGGQNSFEVVLTRKLEVLARGGGAQQVSPCLQWGVKGFRPTMFFFHVVAPSP